MSQTPIHMSCPAGLGQGGLGYHLDFIVESASRNVTTSVPDIYSTDDISHKTNIHFINFEPKWAVASNYTPMRWTPSLKTHLQGDNFDRTVARLLPSDSVILHSFPGIAEHSFDKVHKHGGVTILEAATTHVEDMYREVSYEHKKHRMAGSPFCRTWVDKVLREYERADYITVSSRLQFESFVTHGYPSNKLLFVPLGIDTEKFSPPKEQRTPRESKQGFRIIQVGQVSLLKGVQYLLEALELLNDPEIELVLFGGIGWRSIRKMVERYQKSGFAIRIAQGNPLPWLRTSDVCVHSSIQDGFGLAPLEAMGVGLPTIITETTGVRDAVVQGKSGYVIKPRDATGLALCISELKGDDKLRQLMGHESRKQALLYDREVRIQQYAERLQFLWSAGSDGEFMGRGTSAKTSNDNSIFSPHY